MDPTVDLIGKLGGPAEAKKAGDPIGYVAEWGITVNFEASDLLSDVPKISKHPR
jgi:hypothetical protein